MKLNDAAALQEQSLYEVRRKIYPRAVHGGFAAWRWTLVWATQLVFYGGAWLTWNDRVLALSDGDRGLALGRVLAAAWRAALVAVAEGSDPQQAHAALLALEFRPSS